MNHRLPVALAAVVFPSVLAACGGGTVESSSRTTDALSAGVPQRTSLQLSLAAVQAPPSAAATKSKAQQPPSQQLLCAGNAPAMFAAMTSDIMQNSNGVLDGILTLVENVTSMPPAAVDPDTAVWGPLTSPQSPSIYRVIVHRVAPDAFHFEFDGTPKAGNQSGWAGVMQGTIASPDPLHRAGDLVVDFGVAHALDPSNDPVAGGVAIHFQDAPDGHAIDETFSGVAGKNAPQPNDAHYAFSADPSGVTFDFVTRTDFDHDGTLDELLDVRSRWLAPGAGKASVVVTGGDLGSNHVAAVECWDTQQNAVFYADDIHANPPAGNAACCPQ